MKQRERARLLKSCWKQSVGFDTGSFPVFAASGGSGRGRSSSCRSAERSPRVDQLHSQRIPEILVDPARRKLGHWEEVFRDRGVSRRLERLDSKFVL